MNPKRLAVLILSLNPLLAAEGGQSWVRVHVTDALGNPLPAQKIMVVSDEGRTIEAPEDESFRLTYGRYTVKVRVPGARDAADVFVVDQPEQVLPIAMKLGTMEIAPQRCSITGRVTTEGQANTIRLLQLFGTYSVDVPVVGGTFRFENLECGDYMLIAIGTRGCVATKMARASASGATADIRVSKLSGGACVPAK